MITATIDISKFNRGMAGFVDKLGIEAKVVLKKETGELLKTLIKVTPPADPSKTRNRIKQQVASRFDEASSVDVTGIDQAGESGIVWTRHTKKYLYGISRELDKRSESNVKRAAALYYGLTAKGRRILPFLKPRKRQKVYLRQRIFLQSGMKKKIGAYFAKHVGRLKAGWLASWDVLAPTGGNQPPKWVTRHKQGARGYFIYGLGIKNYPTFIIANTAAGVGNKKNNLDWLAQKALAIRAKAMKTNLALFMRGKKNVGDYAR